jgi:hypothetical protein
MKNANDRAYDLIVANGPLTIPQLMEHGLTYKAASTLTDERIRYVDGAYILAEPWTNVTAVGTPTFADHVETLVADGRAPRMSDALLESLAVGGGSGPARVACPVCGGLTPEFCHPTDGSDPKANLAVDLAAEEIEQSEQAPAERPFERGERVQSAHDAEIVGTVLRPLRDGTYDVRWDNDTAETYSARTAGYTAGQLRPHVEIEEENPHGIPAPSTSFLRTLHEALDDALGAVLGDDLDIHLVESIATGLAERLGGVIIDPIVVGSNNGVTVSVLGESRPAREVYLDAELADGTNMLVQYDATDYDGSDDYRAAWTTV